MLDLIREKIRALIEDISKPDFQVFQYTTSSIFTIAEPNINTITKVLKNGAELGSGEYDFDSTTNKMEITASLTVGDNIEVDYTYYKYSTTELTEFIRASLVWMSIFSYCEGDYELETEGIYPTPANKTTDLIAIIASILIKPNYNRYSLPNLTVVYPKNETKEEKIEKLIMKFNSGIGVTDILEWD